MILMILLAVIGMVLASVIIILIACIMAITSPEMRKLIITTKKFRN